MTIVTRTREEVYKLWLEALRSGKYNQGTGRLRNKNEEKFCCLGVLQDLSVKDGGAPWGSPNGACNSDALPTAVIRNFMGLSFSDCDKLTELNDADKLSFTEIADHIEQKIIPYLK